MRRSLAPLLLVALLWTPACAGRNPLAAIGLLAEDPMQAELRRLEVEQKRMAHEERLVEEAEDARRTEHPDTMEKRLQSGDRHLAAGRLPAALWDYAAAHQLQPNDPAPRVRLGYVHLRVDPDRARPLFESALDLAPDDVSAHVGLGLSLFATDAPQEGLRHLERAVELAPDSPIARAALGVSLDQSGRHDEALVHLERAVALRPHDGRILNNLGVAHLRAGSPERAESLLREALRQDGRDASLRTNNLGLALALQGRFDEALATFRGVGDEQGARSNLGYAHYLRGEYDEAIADYEQALLAGGSASVQVVRNLDAAKAARGAAAATPAAGSDLAVGPAASAPGSVAPGGVAPSAGDRETDVAGEFAPHPADEAGDPWFWKGASIDLPN